MTAIAALPFVAHGSVELGERIAVGGGLSGSRVGQLAIARASLLLARDDSGPEEKPIHHDPDEAGLLGAVRLAPAWVFSGYGAILAVDVGGSNIRAGLVEVRAGKEKESERFNVPEQIPRQLPTIGASWGVLTIGTGLGNAAFTNRRAAG